MHLDRLLNMFGLARFRGRREDALTRLAREGKLGNILLNTISSKGVPVTPRLKNSIDAIVSAISSDIKAGLSDSRSTLAQPQRTASEEPAIIMFTDIVGSTALVEKLGDHRAREVFRAHNEIIRRHTAANQGAEIKIMGDGFMLTFENVRQALKCAVGAQRELQNYNHEHTDATLSVRMGLSIGTSIREDEDLFGRPVIQAARISAQAEGGQILMCQKVHSLARAAPEFQCRELGLVELRGLSGLHTLYEAVWRES